MMRSSPTPELFREFPELRERLPWTGLAQATQVHALERLRSFLRSEGIWVKRDDKTSRRYGGAEARKLEFLFGDVLRSGRGRLLAFDRAGGSSALALCAFAQQFQLQPILALRGSATGANVQRTLEAQRQLGAEIHLLGGGPTAAWRLGRSLVRRSNNVGGGAPAIGSWPYVVWPRKRLLFGTLGFVNAAYELRRQINIGLLPQPAVIYVGVGSGAMLAGLALGLELAGIDTRLVGVTLAGRRPASIGRGFGGAAQLLETRCESFPSAAGTIPIDMRSAGTHARAQAGPQQALGLLRDLEGLDLGSTAAHTMACLLSDVRSGRVQGPVLFWNTHAGRLFHGASPWRSLSHPGEQTESITTS